MNGDTYTVVIYKPRFFGGGYDPEHHDAPSEAAAIALARNVVKDNHQYLGVVTLRGRLLANVTYVPAKTIGRAGIVGRVMVKKAKK